MGPLAGVYDGGYKNIAVVRLNPSNAVRVSPAAPAGLTGEAPSDSGVVITWTRASPAAAGYEVQRGLDGTTWATIATINDPSVTTYTDTQLVEGTTYLYRVRTLTAGLPSGWSAGKSLTTLPAAPTTLAVTSDSPDGVALSWQDNSAHEEGFEIEWSDDGVNYYAIDDVGPGVTTYTDTDPDYNQQNYYRVVAYSSDLDSAPTGVMTATPVTAPAAFDDQNAGLNAAGTLSPYTVSHGHSLTVGQAGGVLRGDVNFGGSSAVVNTYTQPANGSVTVDGDGGFTYTPDPSFVGTDTFTYEATNGSQTSTPATVAIDVTNAAPVAQPLDTQTTGHQWFGNDQGVLVQQPLVGHGFVERHRPRRGPGDVFGGDAATVRDAGPERRHRRVHLHGRRHVRRRRRLHVRGRRRDGGLRGPDELGRPPGPVRAGAASVAAVTISSSDQRVMPDSVDTVWSGGTVVPHFAANFYSFVTAAPSHGTLSGPLMPPSYVYTPDAGYLGDDQVPYVVDHTPMVQKPATELVHVYNSNGGTDHTGPSNWWGKVGQDVQVLLSVANTQRTSFSEAQTRWLPNGCGATLQMGQLPAHGTVVFPGTGGFDYIPVVDPISGRPYFGWDFFSFQVHEAWGGTVEQWVQLDVGQYARPLAPRPPSQVQPQNFPASLKGVWDSYKASTARLADVLSATQLLGQAQTLLKDASPPSPSLMLDAENRLQTLNDTFDAYVGQVTATNRLAGAYGKTILYMDQDDADVLAAVQKLPVKVMALGPTREQAEKWKGALDQFGEGMDALVQQQNFNVNFATELHDGLEKTIQLAGAASMAVTGAELLAEESCAAFAKYAAQQIVNTAVGVAASYAAQNALDLASRFGISVNPDLLRIGADAIQVVSLMRAARAERAKLSSNCFVAGTKVITANGPVAIENVRDDDEVLTRDAKNPSAPVEYRPVLQLYRHTVRRLEDVTVIGSDGRSETFRCTPEHPFYVEGPGWTIAGDLAAGEKLLEPDGREATVASTAVEDHPEGVEVYNFEVEEDHSYFVGDGTDAVWVHNSCYQGQTPNPNAPQTRGKPSSSDVLRRNLKKANVNDPARGQSAAHHIVAGNEPLAAQAKARLEAEGIDINEAANGVYLPRHPTYADPPTLTHPLDDAYYRAVTKRITGAAPGTLRQELANIRNDLLNGNKFW